MKEQNMRENFLDKLKVLKNRLNSEFDEDTVHNLTKIMSKIAHYHYNKQKFMLMGETRKLYNFLIENGYNPYTVYRWMLLDKLPEDIRFQVRQGEINQKTAVANGFERRQENDTTLAQGIKFSGIALIRRM